MTGVRALVRAALDEDVGGGDVTTQATVPADRRGVAVVLVKEDLVLAGLDVARTVFEELAARMGVDFTWTALAKDGDRVAKGAHVARVEGPLGLVLTGERCALNFLMRMSGIATNVARYVEAAGPTGPRVVDTRKTTPVHRELEKYAVRCGGGHNHRHALYDGVLIKDNHIAAVGSVSEAIRRARASAHHLLKVECEVTTLDQLAEAIDAGADAILLDNFTDEGLFEAVRFARARSPRVVLEGSGGMTPARITNLRDSGLDLVSAGGLVHQARWVDLSLDVIAAG